MQKSVYDFWKWVDTRMEQIGIQSYRDLEARSGFANGAIGRRRNADKFPTVEMAEGMCQALQVSWLELWKQAGFITEAQIETDGAEEREALGILRGLSGARRNAVLDMLRGARAKPSPPPAGPTQRPMAMQDLPAEPLMEPEALEQALDWWSEILANAPAVARPILARLLYVAANWYEHGKDVEQLIDDILKDDSIADSVKKKIIEVMQESRRKE